MEHDLNHRTLKEFQEMKNFAPTERFDSVIIVPLDEIHESGYACMKFILARKGEIVGVVGGYSDVAHINGIGGYGLDFDTALRTRKVPVTGWRIDCLPGSHCVRLFTSKECVVDDFIGSDFEFYTVES